MRIVGVCNRRRESATRVAREFDIPKVYGNWEDLVADPDVDAVVIGAWPYLHCPVTLAAFDAGKHVLTQARMALNAREAQRMHDRALESPRLTAMIVPSPYGLAGDAYMRSLIDSGFLGTLREVHVHSLQRSARRPGNAHELAAVDPLLGLQHADAWESFMKRCSAGSRPRSASWPTRPRSSRMRFDPEQEKKARVGTPDSVHAITTQEDGSNGVYRFSGVVWHENSMGVALYGSEGTLIYDLLRDEIRGARRQDAELQPMPIPDSLRGGWQVEADFIAAIRGERPVTRTDFLTGVRYMQFTEAVARSSRHQIPVTLPLREFSNPSL